MDRGYPTTRTSEEARVSQDGLLAQPVIPDFKLIRLIGQGSYGDVWLAEGVTGLRRAVKVIWRSRFEDAKPFEREFQGVSRFAAISLQERTQLAVVHIGKSADARFFFYVMELADDVSGLPAAEAALETYQPKTLREVKAATGRFPPLFCLKVAADLAKALQTLHARGLLHRDIKPSNVIFVGGVCKLSDIGLTVPVDEDASYVGTEGFVPPEGPGTTSADIYGLGKVIYEMATGLSRLQYPSLPSDLETISNRSQFLALNDIVLRACDNAVARRYSSVDELLVDLKRAEQGIRPKRSVVSRRRLVAVSAMATVSSASIFFLPQFRAGARLSASSVSNTIDVAPSMLEQAQQLSSGIFDRTRIGAAEALATRVTEMEPHRAEAWALRAYCGACQLLRGWDRTVVRRQGVQEDAERALALDPSEPTALLALSILFRIQGAAAEAEAFARRGLVATQIDSRLWRALCQSLLDQGREEEALRLADEISKKFSGDPLVQYDVGLMYGRAGDFAAFEAQTDVALQLRPFTAALIAKIALVVERRGDLPEAQALLMQIPEQDRTDHRVVATALNLSLYTKDADGVLKAAARTTASYFADNVFRAGPKAVWVAYAYRALDKTALEREAWLEAVSVLEDRLSRSVHEDDRARLAIALAALGRSDEAMGTILPYLAKHREDPRPERAVLISMYYAEIQEHEESARFLRSVLDRWNGTSLHLVRLHPAWDKVRENPIFFQILNQRI